MRVVSLTPDQKEILKPKVLVLVRAQRTVQEALHLITGEKRDDLHLDWDAGTVTVPDTPEEQGANLRRIIEENASQPEGIHPADEGPGGVGEEDRGDGEAAA